MKKLTVLFLAFAVTVLTAGMFLPVKTSGQKSKFYRSNQPIPNQYIVVLNEDFVGRFASDVEVGTEAQFLTSLYGGNVRRIYSNAVKGYSATMSALEAEDLSRNDRVLFVEEDSIISVSSTQPNAGWNLDRVDQRNLPLDSNYSYTQNGLGAHVYIIDTGIRITHQEFGGRATVAFDALNDGQNGIDCNGHGTHVAGIVGGATYGVAKAVSLHSVRVLPCGGNGSIADLMTGIDWVTGNRINPAVANISITAAGSSSALETVLANSIASGVVYTVAAGNSAFDACSYTPARTPAAITVGASAQSDERPLFSNFGPCVDIFAPGFQIISAGIGSDTTIRELSGTSMAAPMVAGVAALYRAANPSANPTTVSQAIIGAATTGVITNPGVGSPNKLLYSWVTGAPAPTPTATPTPAPTVTPTPSPTPGRGRITIRKQVQSTTSSTTAFPYAATNLSTPSFTLLGDQEFTQTDVLGSSQVVAVTENTVEGWRLTSVACVEVAGGSPNLPNTTVDLANRRANIIVEDGESVTCTFTSERLAPTAGEATVGGRIIDRRGRGVRGISLSLFDAANGQTVYATTNSFGYYSFTGLDVPDFYVLTAFDTFRYTILDNVRSFTLRDDLANVDFVAEAAVR